MGAVKIDIHKNNYEWQYANLSTIESIRGLLKYRTYYDTLYSHPRDIYNCFDSHIDAQTLCEEIICLYIWLDDMIKKANLTKTQKGIINLYMGGYNESDIVEKLNISRQSVNGTIKSACQRILKAVEENWKLDFAYWNKVKVDTDFKQCSKCKENLPATEEYFGTDERNKDNFKSYCKKCDNYTKKS